jgi:orsellinic acid/F9775 biosynthesis protein OrsD
MSNIKGHRFHPFQKAQTAQVLSTPATSSRQPSEISVLSSSPLLDYLGYRFNSNHSVMICVACECAILSCNGLGHVKKKHDISVSREQQTFWDQIIEEWGVTSDTFIAPPKDHKPVELLKLHPNAFCCNYCQYASLTQTTFSKHWSTNHKSIDLEPSERYHEGWVQTFYSHAPCTYFEVNVPIPNSTPLFDVYMKKEIPSYPLFDVIIPSAPREIPPLLYSTRWHEHLADYITDKPKRRMIFSLAHPGHITKEPLWRLVWDYLDFVVDIVKDTSMRVRCLLTEYPR